MYIYNQAQLNTIMMSLAHVQIHYVSKKMYTGCTKYNVQCTCTCSYNVHVLFTRYTVHVRTLHVHVHVHV